MNENYPNEKKAIKRLFYFLKWYNSLLPKDKAIFIENNFKLPKDEHKSNFDTDLYMRAIEEIDRDIMRFELSLLKNW